jgi:glycosyltransferase involved in cell wall biosynthesis
VSEALATSVDDAASVAIARSRPYKVIHVVTSGEFMTPLVASQVFDHAEVQATASGADAPSGLATWLVEPMRRRWNREARRRLAELRARAPSVDTRLVTGIGRLAGWPTVPHAKLLRRRLGAHPVVYHCRGEHAVQWALRFRGSSRDAVVLDVRGAWPFELLLRRGITDPAQATGTDRAEYVKAIDVLRDVIARVDGVTTVSSPLRDWLIELGAASSTHVVPCCVRQVTTDERRDEVRRALGLGEGPVVSYLGTVQERYQGFESLVLPFVRAMMVLDARVSALFLTSQPDQARALVERAGMPASRVRIATVPQAEVRSTIAAADVGLILRPPIALNRFSQPTKLAEYLASGVPVVTEQGTGEVGELLEREGAGLTVATAGRTTPEIEQEARRVLEWLARAGTAPRPRARALTERCFTWEGVSHEVRLLYREALDHRSRVVG